MSRIWVSDGKLLKKHQGKGRFWLKHPNRSLVEGRPGCLDIIWGMVEDEETNEILMVI